MTASAALELLARFRVLCAHRRGAAGVDTWTGRIEEWLSESVAGFTAGGTWYLGRPVIVTANDYGLRLFNGDTGAVVARPEGGVGVVFRQGDDVVSVSPSRLSSVGDGLRHDRPQGARIRVPRGRRRASSARVAGF